jgi:pantetheine-phosphate adenylyltransferase
MKEAIYAGSFDPWSFGHQFVLESALKIFDRVHVLAAVNPAKPGEFDSQTRIRAIAHAIDPIENWWSRVPPFVVGKNVVIAATTGLVVDYARQHNIVHLIRGLRSTSDFESEFNLYFSNRAIHSEIQTFCILCPPELLHCSSTFVRSVVGAPTVHLVGTTFVSQAILLKWSHSAGRLFDILQALSKHRFEQQPADLTASAITAALQRVFLLLAKDSTLSPEFDVVLGSSLESFLVEKAGFVRSAIADSRYPEDEIHKLWAILISSIICHESQDKQNILRVNWVRRISQSLGKTEIPLFIPERVLSILEGSLA